MAATDYEKVADWLRTLLVTNMPWDYCVIWTLGDDPSRFFQRGACCCSGGNEVGKKIKTEKDDLCVVDECKDQYNKHPARTHACKLLAKLPDAIPLYIGIHGDVLMSKKPSWLNSYDEPNGTHVLIPTAFGLIELFSSKHLPEDQQLMDFISSHFNVPYTQYCMSNIANINFNLGEQISYPLNLRPNCCNFDRSCTSSSISTEHQPVKTKTNKKDVILQKQDLRLIKNKAFNCDMGYKCDEVSVKDTKNAEKEPFKSKNLLTERNRRERIKKGIYTLRALVPNISKMDKMATVDDAANYIKELQTTIENYCDELTAMEEKNSNNSNANANVSKLLNMDCVNENQSIGPKKTPMEIHLIEVGQTGKKDFLLKLICTKKQGGFSRLMEAINSLWLVVTDANVTTLDDSVLNVLKLETDKAGLEPNDLKDSLIQLLK